MPTENQDVATPEADVPATPAADAPVETPAAPTEAERMEAVFEAATADNNEPAPVEGDPETQPATDDPPVVEADQPPAADPPADPPVPLTAEEQDAADAKALGFKNQKANAEFKRMRGVEREYAAVKEKLPELESNAQRWGETFHFLQHHGIGPERFKQTMTMAASLASDDINILRKAREGLQWELQELNKRLGEEGAGYDPLTEAGNADLSTAVQNEEMTRERALAAARERREAAHYRTQHETRQQQTQEQAQRQQAVQAAAAELDAVQKEYEALDPLFRDKVEQIIPTLKVAFEDIHPSKWAEKFKRAYAEVKLAPAAAPAPASTRPPPLKNQPLRPSSMTPGSVTAAAKTPDEIMAAAIQHAAALDGRG